MDTQDYSTLASDYSFRDCLLVCSNTRRQNLNMKVHKVVLGSWSDKFEREFTGTSSRNETITLRCDPKVFDTFIQYLYTTPKARYGLININNAESLFLVAAEWDINLLKHHCEEFWLTEFTSFPKQTILALLNFAVANEIHGLQRRCFEFLARNMDDIPTASLKMLNREQMMRIILEVSITGTDLSLCFTKLVEWAYTCNIKCQMIVDMMTKAGWPEAEINTHQMQSMKLSITKYQKLLHAPVWPLYKYVLELSLIAHRNREATMQEHMTAQHNMNYKLKTLRKHWAERSQRINEELGRVKHQMNPVVYAEIERQLFAVGDSVAKAALYEESTFWADSAADTSTQKTAFDRRPMKEKMREIDHLSMGELRRMTFTPTHAPQGNVNDTSKSEPSRFNFIHERHERTNELRTTPSLHSLSGKTNSWSEEASNWFSKDSPDLAIAPKLQEPKMTANDSASASGPRVSWSNGPSRISWSDKVSTLPLTSLGLVETKSPDPYQNYFEAQRSRTRSRPTTDSPKEHRAFRANTATMENTLLNSQSSKALDNSKSRKDLDALPTPDAYEEWYKRSLERNPSIDASNIVE